MNPRLHACQWKTGKYRKWIPSLSWQNMFSQTASWLRKSITKMWCVTELDVKWRKKKHFDSQQVQQSFCRTQSWSSLPSYVKWGKMSSLGNRTVGVRSQQERAIQIGSERRTLLCHMKKWAGMTVLQYLRHPKIVLSFYLRDTYFPLPLSSRNPAKDLHISIWMWQTLYAGRFRSFCTHSFRRWGYFARCRVGFKDWFSWWRPLFQPQVRRLY